MTGEIEKDPLTFISSFIDVAYESKEDKRILIDNFKNKYAIYQGVSLIVFLCWLLFLLPPYKPIGLHFKK